MEEEENTRRLKGSAQQGKISQGSFERLIFVKEKKRPAGLKAQKKGAALGRIAEDNRYGELRAVYKFMRRDEGRKANGTGESVTKSEMAGTHRDKNVFEHAA